MGKNELHIDILLLSLLDCLLLQICKIGIRYRWHQNEKYKKDNEGRCVIRIFTVYNIHQLL
jgi:hypothetical protein